MAKRDALTKTALNMGGKVVPMLRMARSIRLGVLAAAAMLLIACHVRSRATPAAQAGLEALQPLRDFENARRATTDFAHLSASDTTLGPDPYVVRRLPGDSRFVGLLRGRSAVVLLDEALHEQARLDAPVSPSSLAIGAGGDIFVAGELSHTVRRYRLAGNRLRSVGVIDLPDVSAIRGLATGPDGVLYVVEEHDGRLLTLKMAGDARGEESTIRFRRIDTHVGHGPLRVARVGQFVVVDCLLDHALVVKRVDSEGVPLAQEEARIVHDGPIWGFDAVEAPRGAGERAPATGALLVAAGGVEDHPLDRTQGSFGFVDSFVYLYRVEDGAATRLAAVNTSAFGLITPKALRLALRTGGGIELTVAAYGSDRWAQVVWSPETEKEPVVTAHTLPPGTAALETLDDGGLAIANPLVDAWVRVAASAAVEVVHVEDEPARERSVESRVGEALFFTSLMAPWDKSEGRLSRFTCETCHFQGYVDGRTHYTGRGNIHATTKPLLGLFNNKPHFSRALDPDLTTVANNEFIVAGAKSDHDPWFAIEPRDFPWLAELGAAGAAWPPQRLRRALMTFLMEFTHRPNPSVVGRKSWTPVERLGAETFRDRCESCHAARLVADDPASGVPFERWESLVMAPEGPLVWARAEYEKTGVEPYVNEKGARVVSLRRLYKKYPYFTNGTAKSLADVLDRVAYGDRAFFHDRALEDLAPRRLTEYEKTALLAFLDLL